jgi:hypothetical protein
MQNQFPPPKSPEGGLYWNFLVYGGELRNENKVTIKLRER